MNLKCIAIGNRIMGDDGVGIKVAEELSKQLKREAIEVIFGETDFDYALSSIEDGDYLFIIDSTYFDIQPGTVTFTHIHQSIGQYHPVYSQHQSSFIHLLKAYRKSVEGYVIGIEVEKIDFSLELSNTLKTRFPHICEEVYQFIYQIIRRGINA